jgi:hypothetical protein
MTGPRVTLHWQNRSVAWCAEFDGHNVSMAYGGIVVTCRPPGLPERHVWVPQGAHPTFADDEALITAIRQAVRDCRQGGALLDTLLAANLPSLAPSSRDERPCRSDTQARYPGEP